MEIYRYDFFGRTEIFENIFWFSQSGDILHFNRGHMSKHLLDLVLVCGLFCREFSGLSMNKWHKFAG